MLRSYKIRLYPNKNQAQQMFQHIGASRYIWNWAIDIQKANHAEGKPHIKSFDIIRMLTPLKHDGEHEWLNDVSNATLQHSCVELESAYSRFFKKQAGYPQYRSRKRSAKSFAVDSYRTFFKTDRLVQLPVIGFVKYKTDLKIPIGKEYHFKDPRVMFKQNKWFLSICVEVEKQDCILTNTSMGIDLGVKATATVVNGTEQIVYPNINKSKQVRNLIQKEKYFSRRISKKYEFGKHGCIYTRTRNIEKLENKVRRIRNRIANIRSNYNHQMTAALVNKLPKRVVMEDLNVLGMMKNKHLAKAVQSQNFDRIYRMMKYKCENKGIEFVTADRFFPSSRLCGNCGSVNKKLTLTDRTFVCPECGYTCDRDFNAAQNLMEYKVH